MLTTATFAILLSANLAPASIEVVVDAGEHHLVSARYQLEEVACDGRSLGARRITVERSGALDRPHPFSVTPGCYRIDFAALDRAGRIDAACQRGEIPIMRVEAGAARAVFVADCERTHG